MEPARWPVLPENDGGARFLRCRRGHRFDAARQGYFNLLTGRGTAFAADTAAMVQARIDFLGSGHFQPLADALSAAAAEFTVERPVVLDVGAGTGHYLAAVRERVNARAAVALDISKFALRRAVRLVPDALCLVWDVWRSLPLGEAGVDLMLNVFAPRNAPEFARVCRDGAILLVVTPLPRHLQEIAEGARLLDIRPGKDNDVAASLTDGFEAIESRTVEFQMMLSPVDVRNVAAMGPAGHHRAPSEVGLSTPASAVTAAFTLQVFRRRIREVSKT